MSISSEITRIQNAKTSLATSITNKGVTVPDDVMIEDMAALVDSISTGANINGETKSYLATANISKGDFVQLTTKGIEEPALTAALTWNKTLTFSLYSSVCVLSSTQVIVVWSDSTTASVTGTGTVNVYAQVASYINGVWVAGTRLLLHTPATTTSRPFVAVDKLTSDKAVILYQDSSAGSNVFVVGVAADGTITVKASRDDINSYSSTNIGTVPRVIVLSPTTFVLLVYDSSLYDYFGHACTYIDGVLTVSDPIVVATGSSSSTLGDTACCKLNENQVLVWSTGRLRFYIITVDGSSLSAKTAEDWDDLSDYDFGQLVYWEDNVVLRAPYDESRIYPLCFLTYDVENNTLSEGEDLIGAMRSYLTMRATKISDDKACLLMGSANSSSGSVYFGILDVVNQTIAYKSAPITFNDSYNNHDVISLNAADGLLAVIEYGTTQTLYVAPCVSQTTAAPYATRIDGVANNGVSAGQTAEVIVPWEV